MIHSKSIQDLSFEVAQSYKPDINADTRWHTSGLIDFQAPFNRFVLDKSLPLITEGADEQVGRGRSQHIDRNTTAILLDWNLRRLSQGRAVIDLRMGEFLVKFRKRHPEKLGYVHLPDYTREEMGIPWRSASQLVSNWTSLESLPHLRQAHREGKISKSKLRWLLRVITPQNEEAWIERASKLSVRALEDEVRANEARRNGEGAGGNESSSLGESDGKCVPVAGSSGSGVEEECSGYLMSLETTPERAAAWDFALEHFRGHEGGNFSTAFFIEALLAEFCSAVPLPTDDNLSDKLYSGAGGSIAGNTANLENPDKPTNPVNPAAPDKPVGPSSTAITPPLPGGANCLRITGTEDDDFFFSNTNNKELDEEREKWRALRRDLEEVTKIWEFLSWTPVTVEAPPEWDYMPEDARALADMIKELVVMRQSVGFYMGRLLRTMENLHLYSDLQFASFNHYVVERLGISMRTARNLIKLVREFLSLPLLEKAFKDGVLTQERALLLLKVVAGKTEREWLKYGTEVPVLDLEREVKRLSRLIEVDKNLLEKHNVIPGFESPEEAKNQPDYDSPPQSSLALDATSDVSKENSCSSGEICATELLPDSHSPEAADTPGNMSTAEKRPNDNYPEDDDSPWKVCINSDMADINNPTELDSWKMVVTGILPDENDLQTSDSSWKMCATEILPDTNEPETSDSSWKICATEMLPDENEKHSSEEVVSERESNKGPASENAAGSGSSSNLNSDYIQDSNSSLSSNPSPSSNPNSIIGTGSEHGTGSATIRFFVPNDLIPLWNYAFMRYLELATGSSSSTHEISSSIREGDESTSSGNINAEVSMTTLSPAENKSILLEGFLLSLIYHYLENEHIYQKKKRRLSRHKVIERDELKCMIPGCSSRGVLNDHHIKYRSHGGGDELPNNTTACNAHHKHCIHDNHYITISGTAPDNLTIAMGVESGSAPFALFINGRRKSTS